MLFVRQKTKPTTDRKGIHMTFLTVLPRLHAADHGDGRCYRDKGDDCVARVRRFTVNDLATGLGLGVDGVDPRPGIDLRVTYARDEIEILKLDQLNNYVLEKRTPVEEGAIALYGWAEKLGLPMLSNAELRERGSMASGVAVQFVGNRHSVDDAEYLLLCRGQRGAGALSDNVLQLLWTFGRPSKLWTNGGEPQTSCRTSKSWNVSLSAAKLDGLIRR